ncbi:helix-turn-helix domain-containing protein [Streptomyces sp. NPDC026589]|uniref:helix-turn-helix domain-containing protein n=1 Tax=Streptomyces sp. NPDC026589 TaxID=3155609 RepID=UPI0033E12803
MSFSGRSSAEFVLTADERDQLVRWSQGASRLAVRARIVLRCAEPDVVYARLAEDLGVSAMTVGKWRKRFTESRLEGLADADRPGRPKAGLSLSDLEREQLAGRGGPRGCTGRGRTAWPEPRMLPRLRRPSGRARRLHRGAGARVGPPAM